MNTLEQYADDQLLLMLKGDSRLAFNEIYHRYWKLCYHSAIKISDDRDTCLDIVQDVFVWLWENRGKIAPVCLRSYLCTAVKFKMLNVIRRGKMNAKAVAFYKEVYHSDCVIEDNLEVKELKRLIDDFVDKLPPQAGKIFRLSRNERLSHKEIALQLNLSEKTVRNQINLTLKKLRSTMGHMSIWISLL